MNKILWSCAALLTLIVTVESLSCYTCNLDILSICLTLKPMTCTKAQDRCYKGEAEFNNALYDIEQRGCIESNQCINETGSILNINYTLTRTCCSKDLCNGAASIQLPLTAALAAALVPFWSQWAL